MRRLCSEERRGFAGSHYTTEDISKIQARSRNHSLVNCFFRNRLFLLLYIQRCHKWEGRGNVFKPADLIHKQYYKPTKPECIQRSGSEHRTCCAAFRCCCHPARPENNHKSCSCLRLLSAGAAETAHNMKAVMDGILCMDGLFRTSRLLLFHAGWRASMAGKPSQINWTKGDKRDLLTKIKL